MFVLISKRLPPTRCGIGDYSFNLAGALAAHGARVAGLAWERPPSAAPVDHTFPVHYLAEASASSLATALHKFAQTAQEPLQAILQTSQYDAHPRALASWLTRGLEQSRTQGIIQSWIVMLHEIWLPELARRRDVWIYPWQRAAFAGLTRAADAVAVTCETYARRVKCLAPSVRPTVLPVFSNFAEPAIETALAANRDAGAWAVFGSTSRIRTGLKSLLDDPPTKCLREQIACLEVFGGEPDAAVSTILSGHRNLSQRYQPAIPAAEAGQRLQACHAAWIDYPESQADATLLGKSTLLAAAIANGALPVMAYPATGFFANGEPLPCWFSTENPPPPADSSAAQSARAANLSWYHRHAARTIHAQWCEKALRAN